MIERYSISCSRELLSKDWGIEVPDFYAVRYNAAPTQLLPVLTDEHPQGISLFYWGTTPEWSKNKTPSEKVVNIRVETIFEKPAIKRALMNMRCLIPADGFYVWHKVGKKTHIPYRVTKKDKSVFSIGGIWEEFENEDGEVVHTFMMLTLPANTPVAPIHDRMPFILTQQQMNRWLNRETSEQELQQIIRQPAAYELEAFTVSPRIFDIANDGASLIQPTPPADQHGNLTLFS